MRYHHTPVRIAIIKGSTNNKYSRRCSNYHTIALISLASEVMLKIFQARLQKYMN